MEKWRSGLRFTCRVLALQLVLLAAGLLPGGSVHAAGAAISAGGRLVDGAMWKASVPARWNGTLLLFSHGYSFELRPPELAPAGVEDWLLRHGYALLASSYSKPGWALAEAVPDQLAALDVFIAKVGKPKRTIAWGESMGGLVTVALAETHPQRFAAALPECGSLAGSIGMMNEALDGAFAFKTLLAPHSDIRLVATGDDRVNAARAEGVLRTAMQSPQGRARIALASALAQIPPWTVRDSTEPSPDDPSAQLSQIAASFVMGVFLPRADQEKRAGGVFSWNVGVDYRQQLALTGRREWVERWYRDAGLDLDRDLATLDASARISAAPDAVTYMRAHYAPSGVLEVPMLSMHTLGDGMTVPTQEQAYETAVRAAGNGANLATAWVHRAGHCNFTPAEEIAALQTLIDRLDDGRWHASARELNARAQRAGLGQSAFVDHHSAPFLRPCRQAQRCSTDSYTPPPRHYDGLAETSLYIRSDDGTGLAVTVHRPTKDGRLAAGRMPVIVTQDRTDAPPGTMQRMRFYTDRGYVWVSQDRRGTGASFGVQTGFVTQQDLRDAKAVIEWAGAQKFSNQKVVALGCSNQGIWQYGVAALHPKGLVAIAPACSSPQLFGDAISRNGIPMFPLAAKPYAGQCDLAGNPMPGPRRPAPVVKPVDVDVHGRLLAQAQKQHRCDAPFLGQYWINMPRDGYDAYAGYRPGIVDSPISHAEQIGHSRVAILQLGGWYDAAVAGQLEGERLWGGLLILGPWVHGNRVAPGVDFPDGTLDLQAQTLRWFDHFAKGIANGAGPAGILYYTVNAPAGSHWHRVSQWPPAGRSWRTYYLTQTGLSGERPMTSGASAVYVSRDVRWFDGRYQPLGRSWNGDMSAADAESLAETSAPLPFDTQITGTPVAQFWISADAPDVNVYAVLEDVSADGRSTYITDGRLRASWRKLARPPWGNNSEHWHRGNTQDIAPLTAGKPTELIFDFYAASYVVRAGHRLRVSLATSLGKPWQAPPLAGAKLVTLTVYRDASHASEIRIPVVGGRSTLSRTAERRRAASRTLRGRPAA
ncbi:MAG: CocE/NonD family hydrolase [Acetobacteraceae bacterium]